MRVDTLQPHQIDSTLAKPQAQGWWYSNKIIKNINLAFLDLEKYKRKVSQGDSIIIAQDTIIIGQSKRIESAELIAKESAFKSVFYQKFAESQQQVVITTFRRQNLTNLALGVSIGLLIMRLVIK